VTLQAGLPTLPVLLFLGVVLVLALTRARPLPGRAFALFRALFPSWRFFEDLASLPQLKFRTSFPEGPWVECIPPHHRNAGAVFLNASGNLRHACNSLVEQTVSDIAELTDLTPVQEVENAHQNFSDSVSYRLTCELVRYQLLNAHGVASGTPFQFKITSAEAASSEQQNVLVSLVHEV
jgi:hypothetical protein